MAQAIYAANLLVNVWLAKFEEATAELRLTAEQLIAIYELVQAGSLSSTNAKALFVALSVAGADRDAHELAKEKGLIQVSDTAELEKLVEQVIADNPQAATDVKQGELKAIGFLVGQVMKLSHGQANPQVVQELLLKILK